MSITVFGEKFFSEQSQDLYNGIVEHVPEKTFLEKIDRHNAPTGAHSRAVAQVMAEFATADFIDFSPSQQESIIRLATLHDLGKLSLLNSMLDSSGRLTATDWEEIEKHPIEGFKIYAEEFGALEAIPVLLHHTMQLRSYPSREKLEEILSIYGLSVNLLADEEILTKTVLLAISDHLEARYPITDILHLKVGIRIYDHRNYLVEELPDLVEASLTEAGTVRKLGLNIILRKAITHFQEVIQNNQNIAPNIIIGSHKN